MTRALVGAIVTGPENVGPNLAETTVDAGITTDPATWRAEHPPRSAPSITPESRRAAVARDGAEDERRLLSVDYSPAERADLEDALLAEQRARPSTTIPAVHGPGDVDTAIRFAMDHPETRWYAVKKAAVHNLLHRVPSGWPETRNLHVDLNGVTYVLPPEGLR